MIWPFRRRTKLKPDLEGFHRALINSVVGRDHDGHSVAGDFRALFNREPLLGQRVLFMLLKWCGEYEGPPSGSTEALQRWAGKRELAGLIKAAMYADLSHPPDTEELDENVREDQRR